MQALSIEYSPAREYVYYPESDGTPMGETGWHIQAMLNLFTALQYFFRQKTDVYIAANMFLYYEEGRPQSVRAPDVMVIRGIDQRLRATFKLWEEAAGPCFIVEFTSASTRLEDLGTKKALYEMLGVAEYFIFDPCDEYLRPRFRAFRLNAAGEYEPVPLDPDGGVWSQQLEAHLRPDADRLRVIDPATGQPIPDLVEAMVIAQQRLQELDSQSKILRMERARADEERARADEERARADKLAERLRRAGIDPDES